MSSSIPFTDARQSAIRRCLTTLGTLGIGIPEMLLDSEEEVDKAAKFVDIVDKSRATLSRTRPATWNQNAIAMTETLVAAAQEAVYGVSAVDWSGYVEPGHATGTQGNVASRDGSIETTTTSLFDSSHQLPTPSDPRAPLPTFGTQIFGHIRPSLTGTVAGPDAQLGYLVSFHNNPPPELAFDTREGAEKVARFNEIITNTRAEMTWRHQSASADDDLAMTLAVIAAVKEAVYGDFDIDWLVDGIRVFSTSHEREAWEMAVPQISGFWASNAARNAAAN